MDSDQRPDSVLYFVVADPDWKPDPRETRNDMTTLFWARDIFLFDCLIVVVLVCVLISGGGWGEAIWTLCAVFHNFKCLIYPYPKLWWFETNITFCGLPLPCIPICITNWMYIFGHSLLYWPNNRNKEKISEF